MAMQAPRQAGAESDVSKSVSVSDARRRFEMMSTSTALPTNARKGAFTTAGSDTSTTRHSSAVVPTTTSGSAGRAAATRNRGGKVDDPVAKPQPMKRTPKNQQDMNNTTRVQSPTLSDEGGKTKSKSKYFKGLKKAHSVNPTTDSRDSTDGGEPSDSKLSTATRKLFKRKNIDSKSRMDSTNDGGHVSNGTSDTKNGATNSISNGQNSSPIHKKASSKNTSPDSSKSPSQASSPVSTHKQGKKNLDKSLTNKVLACSEERSVQTVLGNEGREKIVGGSLPTAPRDIEDGELKLNLTEDLRLSGAELKSILKKQFAYLTGGLEDEEHLILTFPEVGLKQLETAENFRELMITIIYYKSLISIKQLSAGFTILLDAHSSKTHSPAKHLLEKMVQKNFPVSVHMVYIYVRTGLFGRSKNLASPDVCAKLHLATFSESKGLVDQLGSDNLTSEFGGTLHYDHNTWIFNRLEFEKMQALHRRAMSRVPEVTGALTVCEVPSSVKEAEHLMLEDLKLKENLVNRITEAELGIDRLISILSEQKTEEAVEVGSNSGKKEYVTMKESLKDMLVDLKASQGQFDVFWTVHKARVDHMMRMCHFKRTADKLEHLVQGFTDDLTEGGVHLGDTLESALELGEKHEAFVNKCKSTMEEQMGKMREDADILTQPKFSPTDTEETMHDATKEAIESVKLSIQHLNSIYQQLITMCQQKRDLFIVCVKFHLTTRQCSQWNEDVLEFLASQPMESPSLKQAHSLNNKIEDFLCRVQPMHVQSLQELANALPGERVFQKSAQKTSQKYDHCCQLLNNRKLALLKVINVPSTSDFGTTKSRGKKNKDKDKPDIEILNSIEPSNGNVKTVSGAISTANPEASLYLSKTLAGEFTDYNDEEEDAATIKSRQFIYKELVATENDYKRDLSIVIDSYYDAMADEDSESLPLRLRGKRDVIFGNLPEIYKFHESVFSKALEQFEDHPERIGECFIQFTEEFQMYSVYCKNRANSETLLNESTESEAFFKGIQRNLDHPLPLNSYLLKPVQRITKYQLLLKDMIKRSKNAHKAHSDLQAALDRMLKVLKNLNDSLHVVGLKGFPGSLAEQGRLLVHDAFQLSEPPGATRSLFTRAKERHVFLFEKVIIFSKKFEAPVQKKAKKSDNYLYKGHLSLAELALREVVDGQPLQFSLTVHGQLKDFRFQANSKEIHTMWTKEIRRLLQVQFMLMKDMVIKSGTLDRRTYKGKAKHSKDSRLFGDSFKVRPGQSPSPSKKPVSNRFKIFNRRKSGNDNNKIKKSVESSLLASSSYPANIRFGTKNLPLAQSREVDLHLDDDPHDEMKVIADGGSMSSDDEDFDFSEDEEGESTSADQAVDHYESLAPGVPRYYTATSSYSPGDAGDNGIILSIDQEVEVIGINQYGWWWVRATNPSNGEVEEGWVPASYLKVSGAIDIKS